MITEGTRISVRNWWAGEWRGPTVFSYHAGHLHPDPEPSLTDTATQRAARARPAELHIPGTLFPVLFDRHVHMGLIDREALLPGGITHALDLGWIPEEIALWAIDSAQMGSELPETYFVGAFLTAPGGYPGSSGWAPPGSIIELNTFEEAQAAVDAQAELGARAIKLMLNSDAGPLPELHAQIGVYERARRKKIPLIAHAEGIGSAQLAVDVGADLLAHAPFSEVLSRQLLDEMTLMGMQWISTIDIHGWGEQTPARAIAIENVRHFVQLGGKVLYGTDLGNGPLPVGVNERELLALAEAGLSANGLVTSIAGDGSNLRIGPRVAWVPGDPPSEIAFAAGEETDTTDIAEQTARWLAGARGTTLDYLEETLP